MPTIDEALREQERLHTAILATLEPVLEDPDHVRVTPYVRGRGCLCQSPIKLRKQDLEEVQPTGIEAPCCGKRLLVFRVYLHPSAQVPGAELVRQVMSSARAWALADARLADHSPEPGALRSASMNESCDCAALLDELTGLQEMLHNATPSEKAALVRRIRKLQARLDACGC